MTTRNALANGRASSYDFLLSKIRTLEITPGQLGLDLCSGSSIVMNSKTGEILACVSYPGYGLSEPHERGQSVLQKQAP